MLRPSTRHPLLFLLIFAFLASYAMVTTAAKAAEAPNTLTVTESDQGHTVKVGQSGMVTLRLGVQAEAGYLWHITRKDKLQLMGEPGIEQIPPGKPGAPQTQIFRFRASGAGHNTLELAYGKEAKGKAKAATTAADKKFAVTIDVL
ncbi:MAG TPA: protease inhibitor I42 family protein [Thermoanaerobaculia bacterium]|nr:protease inhibitor I42 family protein [Thermoanaerobaculia bacterium]